MKIRRLARKILLFSILLNFGTSLPVLSAHSEVLPDIEAHEFKSQVVRKSSSGRVYLFKVENKDLPKTGSIVVVHVKAKPAFAFRVLKTNAANSEYVGKRVRRYDEAGELKTNKEYTSYEKVADVLPPPTSEELPAVPAAPAAPAPVEMAPAVPQDHELDTPIPPPAPAPVQDLEVYDYDDDLDQSTSPLRHRKTDEELDEEEPAAPSSRTDYEIEEQHRFDPFNNMISVGAGFFKNMANFVMGGSSDNGFAISYTRTLGHQIFTTGKAPQDSFNFEMGFLHYRKIDSSNLSEVYTLMPFYGNLRHHLFFSQSFAFVTYLGIQYDWVMSHENATDAQLTALQGVQPNGGIGFLYNMGPQWYLRADLGIDRIMAGLCVRW